MSTELTARNATAADLVALLNTQKAHKNDIVVPATHVKSSGGLIVVKDAETQLGDDGVTTVNGTYRPTDVFDDGLAEKLGIPRQYLRRLRTERPDILDGTVNGWLHGRKNQDGSEAYPADDRAFLLRLFRGGEGGEGVARAMLSDRYSLSMDNLDVLTAVMSGIQASGVNVITRVSDLSERGMRVRFEAPDVAVEAPGLLDGYRSPFDGNGAARRALQLRSAAPAVRGASHLRGEGRAGRVHGLRLPQLRDRRRRLLPDPGHRDGPLHQRVGHAEGRRPQGPPRRPAGAGTGPAELRHAAQGRRAGGRRDP